MSPHPKNADNRTSVDALDEFCNAAERLASSFSVESRALWAKTPENREDKSGAYLSLPQHLIDSACVALALTQSWLSNQTLRFLEDESGLDSTAIQSLITFVAGSHDIGKATCTFQTQLEPRGDMSTYADRVRAAGLDLTMSRSESRLIKFPHSGASQAILLEWLENHSTRPIAMRKMWQRRARCTSSTPSSNPCPPARSTPLPTRHCQSLSTSRSAIHAL